MSRLSRSDRSILGIWWWTVDGWMLASIALLVALGVWLIQAASPAVALRLDADSFHFVKQHLLVLGPSLVIMLAVSLLSPRQIRILCLAGFVLSLLLVFATYFVGFEIKGGRRWIRLLGFSLQPSEFVKPTFAVVAAWLLAKGRELQTFPSYRIVAALYAVAAALVVMQPDFGMTVVLTVIFIAELFIAGFPVWMMGCLGLLSCAGAFSAYRFLPHVTSRVNRFFNPEAGDTYQIQRSIEAFSNGGWFGTGPGEGVVKMQLPDAHADFIFSVAGEELGLLWCLFILGLFAFTVFRGFWRVWSQRDLFSFLAVTGLLSQFGAQTLINIASALHLIPTKGMTLPFISYGGSSLLSISFGMGVVLALTRRRSAD